MLLISSVSGRPCGPYFGPWAEAPHCLGERSVAGVHRHAAGPAPC